jgi:hypothetical protein
LISSIKPACSASFPIYQALEHIRASNNDSNNIAKEARVVLLCYDLLFNANGDIQHEIEEMFFPSGIAAIDSIALDKFKKMLFHKFILYCATSSNPTLETYRHQLFLQNLLHGQDNINSHINGSGMKYFEEYPLNSTSKNPFANRAYLVAVLTEALAKKNFIYSIINFYYSNPKLGISGTAILVCAFGTLVVSILSGGVVPAIATGVLTFAGSACFIVAYASSSRPTVESSMITSKINAYIKEAKELSDPLGDGYKKTLGELDEFTREMSRTIEGKVASEFRFRSNANQQSGNTQ